jgi:hypothetical protein
MMSIAEIAAALERAWAAALPGREAVERDSVLRELWRLLQPHDRQRPPLRLVTASPGEH